MIVAALQAGQYTLVKASIAGAIVTNALLMLGVSFLLGAAGKDIAKRRTFACAKHG
jgi:Ca2+/H+ antiporter